MDDENKGIEILIVEDSQTQLFQLQYLLEKAGFQVSAAVNGKEALRLLETGLRPTLVISDIMMPEMDGYEFCAQLRADERFKPIPVILLTSLSDPKDVIRGLECGANSFIVKPYSETLLFPRIHQLIDNKEQRGKRYDDAGVDIFFSGEKYFITAERHQILELLLSTYENAYHQNIELIETQDKLRIMNEDLEELVRQRTAALIAINHQFQVELVERRQAEQALAKLKEQYELILQAAGEGIVGQDLEGRITFVNPAAEKMLVYSVGGLIGQSGHTIWHHAKPSGPPCPEEECPIIKACRKGETYRATDEVFWKKDGTSFPVEYVATPVTVNGKSNGMVIIFEDITERKRLQEAEIARISADTANTAKSGFLANMSHELRTPLNSIIGFSEVLQEEMAGDLNEKQQEYVNYILGSGKHLLTLINDILDLSKVESGKMELAPEVFPLRDVLNGALSMFKEKALKHRLGLTLEIEPEAETLIEADERKLKQILFNLLSNAMKFTPDGGSVRVAARLRKDERRRTRDENRWTMDDRRRTRDEEGEGMEENSSFVSASKASDRPSSFEITVTDTGIGIRQEHLGKLFHTFSQLESSYAKNYEGTGLGLALTKKLVKLHGGKIWVTSQEGKGSSFIFTIPARQSVQAQPVQE